MESGDKRLGDFQSELFLQVLILGKEQGQWGRRGSHLCAEVIKAGSRRLLQCYQPVTGPRGTPAPAGHRSFRLEPHPALHSPYPAVTENRLRRRVFSRKRVILSCLFRRLRRGSSCRSAAELGWWPRERTCGLSAARLQLSEVGRWVFPLCTVSAVGLIQSSCRWTRYTEQVELSMFESLFCGAVDDPCVALKFAAS